jgi:outer membrane receptor protein involved in Fe transport
VDSYIETNLDLSYRLFKHTQLLLSVQNLLDDRHAEFVGAPELGRLARVRVTQQW